MPHPPSPRAASPAVLRLLVAFTALAGSLALLCAWGWYREVASPLGLDELGPEARLALAQQLLEQSPGVHRWAYFEPRLGYTLRPGAELTAFGSTFTTNQLGYRTGRLLKTDRTFRVLFVGDSWTFGHGVTEEESFPAVFEEIANQQQVVRGRVDAWTLALPGYNTVAELAGLWFFFDQLRPDVVVLCPTTNDNHSMSAVLPNGSTTRSGVVHDELGDPHMVTYPLSILDSFRFRERWRLSMALVAATARRLESLRVPFLLFFVSAWEPPIVHDLVHEAGITTPYLTAPKRFAVGRWLIPDNGHGTAAANRVFGRNIYQGLARRLGWPELPPAEDGSEEPLRLAPPPAESWRPAADRLRRSWTAEHVPTTFAPSPSAAVQCAGPMDSANGLMGRATTVLVRRGERSRSLAVTVRPIPELPSLYPLTLTVAIPSADGGTRTSVVVESGDGSAQRFEVPLPDDISPGQAIDVVLESDRAAAAPGSLWARSVFVERIEPADGEP